MKLTYSVDFETEGDAVIAVTGLQSQLPGLRWNFGKGLAWITGMKRLSGPKKQSDTLGLRRMAGMIEDVPPGLKDRWLPREEFASLEAAIRSAVTKRFGKGYWIIDFSRSEVILAQAAAVESQYWKISYKLTNGEITFEGALAAVKRTVDYV